jgi:hypothetical protein
MVSSGGGSGSDIASLIAMQQAAQPMAGLPIAGKDSATGDPYDYGKFQNFLPDVKATGPNDSATGLRPDMFTYRGPDGASASRNALAQVISSPAAAAGPAPAAPAAAGGTNWAPLFAQMSPQDLATWQMTMNSSGRGDEAAAALSSWRGG